jgi:hypothetical protein
LRGMEVLDVDVANERRLMSSDHVFD